MNWPTGFAALGYLLAWFLLVAITGYIWGAAKTVAHNDWKHKSQLNSRRSKK